MRDSHLLIVDDDDRIRTLLKRYLARAGYRVTAARDAAGARHVMNTLDFDLAILDIMMPGEDGLSLLRGIRKLGDTPVILLTARGDSSDRIEGLRSGADDYLAKPFEPAELELRIAAILRRAVREREALPEVRLEGLLFDADRNELSGPDQRIRLTETETALIRCLAEAGGDAVSRQALAAATSAGGERAVDVQVTRLRRKIEPDPREPRHLQTVRGIGYRLVVD